jgi:hypothetical protein
LEVSGGRCSFRARPFPGPLFFPQETTPPAGKIVPRHWSGLCFETLDSLCDLCDPAGMAKKKAAQKKPAKKPRKNTEREEIQMEAALVKSIARRRP